MKACIYQKQEPVDIPQIETRILEGRAGAALGLRDLRPADALEPAQPAPPAAAAPSAARRCWSSGLGPAGFTLAHHLMNDGHAVVGDRRAQDRAAAAGHLRRRRRAARACRSARSATSSELLRAARRPRHGRLRRRRRVRHHRALGQEFPQARSACCSSGAREFAMYGGVRFGGTLTVDERLRARLRPHRALRRRRAADHHRR